MRKIIIDIDNTLWDLAPILYRHLKEVAPSIPEPASWRKWDFWEGFMPEMTLYKVIRDIHLTQDHFGVYPDARQFLSALRGRGFYIIIASHREKSTIHAARQWLAKYELPYDEVHLSFDKSVLFPDAWAVVDDSPVTLDKAMRAGIVRAGLRNPWNENENHPLFDNLMEIYSYLQEQCILKKS